MPRGNPGQQRKDPADRRVRMNVSVSPKNAEWLRKRKPISRTLDALIDAMRNRATDPPE